MTKVEMIGDYGYKRVLVGGVPLMEGDAINTNELLFALSQALGFEYERVHGRWKNTGEFVPDKEESAHG
jgi:hypothetical protein